MLGYDCFPGVSGGCYRRGLGDTKDDIYNWLKTIPGVGTTLQTGLDKLVTYIKEEAEAGAKQAIPEIRSEVRSEVRPYVIAAIGLSAAAGAVGVAALVRNRRSGLRGLEGWTYCERKLASKNRFDPRSFRWKKSGKGRVLIGCPKGQWKAKAGECAVGTAAYKVLSPSNGRCETNERSLNKFTAFFSR